MKHIELIEILYKHRYLIDEAFRGESIRDLPSELVEEAAIFQKVAKQYELSDSYVQFANAMLKRVSANYTFGDYDEEIKLLIRQKGDYLETRDKNLLIRIKALVRTLYKKIEQRDILINARINDIVNDNDLSIELIIKDAKEVDDRIAELINAHSEILKIFGKELRDLDEELDNMLIDIGMDLLPLTENIHAYNKRLSDFILRTEKRKEQNKKLLSLSNRIIKEADYELKSLLLSNSQIYHHTLKERESGSIKFLPSLFDLKTPSFLTSLSKLLKIEKTHRLAHVEKPYKISQPIEIKAVRLEIIQRDISINKPEDIYEYIQHHDEIKKFNEKDLCKSHAFKTYLTIVQNNRAHITLKTHYNSSNIRIAKWI